MSARRLSALASMLVVVLSAPAEALARIKLITLPVRERVAIHLDHPGVTLIEEERIVPLVRGTNQVDFSWANTRIDPDSIVFRVLEAVGGGGLDARVLSVSYPPDENALVWAVSASDSGAAKVRISYVLGGLDKDFHYRAVASHDEKELTLFQYMRVNNNANEEYQLAEIWPGFGERIDKPIGLNETKEMLVGKHRGVPVTKTYTCNPVEFGYLDRAQDKLNVPMHYLLKNDIKHGLGQAALPFGKARIFQEDGKGGTAFIGEDWGRFTPVDDEMPLYLGLARDIVVKRTLERNERTRIAGDLYDYDVIVKYEIENFKDSPATLDLVESVREIRREVRGDAPRDPEWELGRLSTLREPDPEKSDADRLMFHVDLPAREGAGKAWKVVERLNLIIKNEW